MKNPTKHIVFYFAYDGYKERPSDFYVVDTEADAQELILSLAQEAQYDDYLDVLCGNEEMSVEEIMDEIGYLSGYAEYYHYKEANYYGG
ncbi:MAG: hypothetical protein J6R67_03225 [Treponema sp.]|nr:hypothetical protein [Treponema sp.]